MESSTSDRRTAFVKALKFVATGVLFYALSCLVRSPIVRYQSSGVPRLTCEQLLQHGPGDHRYIGLSDACLGSGKSISDRDAETGSLEMFHPLYSSALDREPAAHEFRIVLCIYDELERRHIRDDCNARKQAGERGQSELIGSIRKGNIPTWAKRDFAPKYPGLNTDDCWILTVGLGEPTERRASRLFWNGLIGLVLALAMALAARWLRTRPSRADGESDQSH